jgi:ribonuclease R
MRARYAIEPLGHYGLAKKKYTHFTSPIRRYADLVVHRALFDKNAAPAGALKQIAEHISVTERNSADAERDSKDVKLYAFLNAQLESGEPIKYPALVTDVRNFGFFVDVPGLAMSGLVPLSLIEDDFYVFDEARRNLVGRRTRRMIRLGDKLTVQVARVDKFKKQVDFQLAVKEGKASLVRPSGSPPNVVRPQKLQRDNQRPQSSRQNSKRPPPARPENSRPGKSQNDRQSNERLPSAKPATFQTSGSKFSTTQRPLIKSSGSQRFSKRRHR